MGRTTITLDPDMAATLRRLASERGATHTETVNVERVAVVPGQTAGADGVGSQDRKDAEAARGHRLEVVVRDPHFAQCAFALDRPSGEPRKAVQPGMRGTRP